jgi:magnesium-transporting ATPase (P-type)
MPSLQDTKQLAYVPFDPIFKRTEGCVTDAGHTFKTTKGAPNILLRLLDPSDSQFNRIVADVERDVTSLGERGIRTLGVAKTDGNGKWQFLGLLTFLDPPRPDTKQTIDEAAIFGVCVKMITGDHLLIAKETARRLGMGDNIQNKAHLPNLDPVTKEAPKDLVEKYGPMCLMADGFAEARHQQCARTMLRALDQAAAPLMRRAPPCTCAGVRDSCLQVFPEHKFLIVQTLRCVCLMRRRNLLADASPPHPPTLERDRSCARRCCSRCLQSDGLQMRHDRRWRQRCAGAQAC